MIRGVAARFDDDLLRVVAFTPGPAYTKEQVAIDVAFAVGLPGLSKPDRHGASHAFTNTLAGLGVQQALRIYRGPQDAGTLAAQLSGDVTTGRAWVEGFSGASQIIASVAEGVAVGDTSEAWQVATAAKWAAFLRDERLHPLRERLQRVALTEAFVAEHLAVIDAVAAQRRL